MIPYSTKNGSFILKHEDFCCLVDGINIPDELYEFQGQFIINEESFIMGNVTKILFRPYLFVCGEICSLENLKNVNLTINSVKIENNQDIPSTSVINNIQLSYDEEYSFEFQIPPKLKSVKFIISGDIEYKSFTYKENLSFSNEYKFKRGGNYDILFKKNENDNYIVNILGRNGEPKTNHQINLKLYHKYQSVNNGNSILLETDEEGKINLGKLKDIKNYTINKVKIQIMFISLK